MAKKQSRKAIRRIPKAVLRLPDLDQAKAAGLNSLSSIDAQRGYRHAIEEFIEWYCSERRLSFNKTVVVRYRIHLESRHLAPGTVNLRLGAVRRLAYEASDCGLLSPDLAAGIRRVKGSQEDRRPAWELANARTVRAALEHARVSAFEREMGSGALGDPPCLRSSTPRGGEPGFQPRRA